MGIVQQWASPNNLTVLPGSLEQNLYHLNHPEQGWLPQGSPLSQKIRPACHSPTAPLEEPDVEVAGSGEGNEGASFRLVVPLSKPEGRGSVRGRSRKQRRGSCIPKVHGHSVGGQRRKKQSCQWTGALQTGHPSSLPAEEVFCRRGTQT